MSTPTSAGVPPPAIPPTWRLWWYLFRLGGLSMPEPGRIDAAGQPAVTHLVTDVAGLLAMPVPPDIVLVGNGAVRARAGRGRTRLELPVPMLHCLSAAEIRALVARELAYLGLPRAGLLCQLREAREARDGATRLGPGRGRYRRALAATAPLAVAVEGYAEAVACQVAGAQTTARAEAKEATVTPEFGLWANDLRDDLGTALLDIHAGWRTRLAQDDVTGNYFDADMFDANDRATFLAMHAHLATIMKGLNPDDVALRLPPESDRVPLRPLSRDEEETLAREVYFLPVSDGSRFADVGQERWEHMMQEAAERAVRSLDRGQVSPAEAVTALLPSSQPRALAVAEWTLVRHGWRRAHPAVAGLLTGPDGERIDLRHLTNEASRDPAATDDLVRVLRAPSDPM